MSGCAWCEIGADHVEHCKYPESHNWGCGCPSDEIQRVENDCE